ncbi:cobalt-factor II C(20)-methyltransferase [Listeria ivanovii]|uniref:Putative S-adenosyl-methionine: precorrin-2 methyltransferase n=1 Tax=Listeria ivanovii (strain ATCC BAA-678 / PAM 55) TaxID=881621 RepID=G2ZEV3_LISIP|nr:cobalt-factor II C(20)-methyltransferase [Listeria ivanovii]AHI55680.1 cobalt-precorrin-2 C(20)-methyltransferase [Listeria ivanovii WSLC3009]AIS65132.1 cobalt-precorrin-2 C(20)-methyltransferase [Listeria ivanovii subsp. ivanovii]MBC1758141.1 cobalt-factor II C(20)-methyltransferase [Listeria ivanovii]MBK3913018.1 cobalt-factor II C(20)-methyltransferase [Listeria ivanovii subsp. ivanovii]MBK3920865.1 cobalt-factor II C(20)-methyltransferase [Listeria ivanovii subsp. ivanovii]
MAKFYGIGTGPGDSKLVTIEAAERLGKLAILYTPQPKKGGDSLAKKIVAPYLKDSLIIKERHFPMSYNKEEKQLAWKKIAAEIKTDINQGHDVGFITLGDPMIFSTYSYLLELLKGEVKTVTLAGISSFANIASRIELPLVMEEESFAVIPVTAGAEKIEQALNLFDTIVLMKAASNLPLVRNLLKKANLLDSAVVVSDVAMSTEKIIYGMQEINPEEKMSYFTTIIVKKRKEQ